MKKVLALLVLVMFCGVLAACGSKKVEELSDVAMTTYVINKDTTADEHAASSWRVDIHYPQNIGNKDVDQALADYALDVYESVMDDAIEMMPESIEGTETDITGGSTAYESSLSYNIYKPAPNYVSVEFEYWEYTGGAHGNGGSHVITYDLKSGKEVAFSELFPDPAVTIPQFQQKLTQVAADEYGINYTPASVFADPAQTEIINLNSIALTDVGLIYIFDAYAIASYADGQIVIFMSKADLAAMGVNMQFWE